MSEHTPKLEQCVEETVEGSEKSRLVLHSKKPAMNTEGLMLEAGLLVSSHSSPPASFNEKSDHAPKIEGQDKRSDKEGADLELGTKRDGGHLKATVDTSAVECSSDTGKTGYSARTGEEGGSDTGKTGHSTRTGEEGDSDTGKTGHSTRTKRKHKTATRRRQHGELRCDCGNLLHVCGE